MIRQPEAFFGRGSEIGRILSRLGADPPQSVSLVGERRIGKSSLLFHLCSREVQERTLGDSSGLTAVLIDCQQLRSVSAQGFFSLLIERVSRACGESGETAEPSYAAFRSLLELVESRGLKLCLMMDEFDAVTSNRAFGPDFYAFLRSMANNYPLAYLTASKTELQRLCYSQEISDSPFFNIFSNLYLKPFPEVEALRLIEEPSKSQGLPLAPYCREIIDMAGHFPFFLQMACSAYFEELSEAGNGPVDRESARARFLEEATPHFENFWEHLPSDSKSVLRQIMRQQQPAPEDLYICQRLERSGYLRREGAGYAIFSQAFSEHVRILETLGEATSPLETAAPVRERLLGGETLQQYRILERAAEGGMGVIYRALDTSLGRPVALKFIQPAALNQEMTRKRFLHEARAAAALNHSAITSVYELLEHGSQIVLVMEWIDGRSLRQEVLDQGPIEWQRLTRWMILSCEGLEAAHRQGIVHRDIKSSNLMLTPQDELKITDFGLAKQWQRPDGKQLETELTQEGLLLGTLDYISPEQAKGEPVDGRSDLFSLGVVFFEGLTGKLPFHRQSPGGTLRAIFSEPVPYLGLYGVENADRLDRVIRRMVEKSPRDRYQTAGELKRDLKSLLRKRGLFDWLR